MEKRAEQVFHQDIPAQVGFELFIDAIKKYPNSGMAMGARIQQLVREKEQDPAIIGEALLADDARIAAIRKSAISQHRANNVREARIPELSDEIIRVYVGRSFRNAQRLSVLDDLQLQEITGKLYSDFAYDVERDGEASINYFVGKMLAHALTGEVT